MPSWILELWRLISGAIDYVILGVEGSISCRRSGRATASNGNVTARSSVTLSVGRSRLTIRLRAAVRLKFGRDVSGSLTAD